MLKEKLRLEHKLHRTAEGIIRHMTMAASLLLILATLLFFQGSTGLYEQVADIGVFVFAEGVIAGLLFDVIDKRRSE